MTKSFSFALASLALGLGAGAASAQCKCCCAAPAKGVPVAAVLGGNVLAAHVLADDAKSAPVADKEVKLTGTLVCAKCKLKMEGVKECTNALQVKEGEKTVTYLLKDKGSEEDYHQCGGGEKKDVTVAGTESEKDGKKWVKPIKVETKK